MTAVLAYAIALVVVVAVMVIEEKITYARQAKAEALANVDERARDAWNAHAYGVWEATGWYPQELASGVVKWYRVGHGNSVAHGRTTAG